MKLHGSIIDNLANAVTSARRLRGRPVYEDTLVYWGDVLTEARRTLDAEPVAHSGPLEAGIAKLEAELSDRSLSDRPGRRGGQQSAGWTTSEPSDTQDE